MWDRLFGTMKQNTLEPRFTDTRLIQTPRYYLQFSLPLRKALTFSLNSTRLIRTPTNADNGHLFLPNQWILVEIQPR